MASRAGSWTTLRLRRALGGQPQEWLRAAVCAGVALMLTLSLGSHLFGSALALRLLGPLGATAILLFVVPSGAFSQPWSVLGGYLAGTLVSAGVAVWLGHSPVALGVALSGTVLVMCAARCLHPPAGAIALSLLLGGPPGGRDSLDMIGITLVTMLCLLGCALVLNNLTGSRYPRRWVRARSEQGAPAALPRRATISEEDLATALREHGEVVDISPADLRDLVERTEQQALRRNFGAVTASMIMSRELSLASPGMSLERALERLLLHRSQMLPVVDDEGGLVGAVSLADVVEAVRQRAAGGWRMLGQRRKHPSRVEEVMTRAVVSVSPDTPLVDLVPLMGRSDLHCLPVLEEDRVVGVVSQGDLIEGLHRDLCAG